MSIHDGVPGCAGFVAVAPVVETAVAKKGKDAFVPLFQGRLDETEKLWMMYCYGGETICVTPGFGWFRIRCILRYRERNNLEI